MARLVLNGPIPDERLREWRTNRVPGSQRLRTGKPYWRCLVYPCYDVYHGTVANAGSPSWRDYDFILGGLLHRVIGP